MSLTARLVWLEGASTLGVLSLVLALTGPPSAEPWWAHLARAAPATLVCLASFYFHDLYAPDGPPPWPGVARHLCRALGWSAVALAVGALAAPGALDAGPHASRGLLATLGVLLLIRASAYHLARREPLCERVLLLGGGPLAAALVDEIRRRPDLAVRLLGVVAEPDALAGVPRLGGYETLADVVARHRPDRIVVAMAERRGRLPVDALVACRAAGVRVEDAATAFERLTGRLVIEALTPSALAFGDGFRVTRARDLASRALSVVVAAAALVLAAPLMALAALAIRLESPGPVLFVQERVGLRGRVFRLIKFRTMRPATAPPADTVLRDNRSRVTRVGAFLRRYRLDELPQFFNILRGDMNLVGPRPEMAENVATFAACIPYYHLRHAVRPGLTGWAQVRCGYSMSLEEVTRKLCYDLYYVKHMSLLFDLRILLDTVKVVLRGTRPG